MFILFNFQKFIVNGVVIIKKLRYVNNTIFLVDTTTNVWKLTDRASTTVHEANDMRLNTSKTKVLVKRKTTLCQMSKTTVPEYKMYVV